MSTPLNIGVVGLGVMGQRMLDRIEADPSLHSRYIATPPAAHMAPSHAAFDAGLPVRCEKPLTIDFEAAQRCIERIELEGLRAAGHFLPAWSPALQQAFGSGLPGLGPRQRVEIELGFAAGPRPWQAAAGPWRAQRGEWGFVREVLSHFICLLRCRGVGRAADPRGPARRPLNTVNPGAT